MRKRVSTKQTHPLSAASADWMVLRDGGWLLTCCQSEYARAWMCGCGSSHSDTVTDERRAEVWAKV